MKLLFLAIIEFIKIQVLRFRAMEVPIIYLALKMIIFGDIASKWRRVFGEIKGVQDVDEKYTVRRAENERIAITQSNNGSIFFMKKYIPDKDLCYTDEEVQLLDNLLTKMRIIFNIYWYREPTTSRSLVILRDAQFDREVEAHPYAEREPMIERKYSRMYNVWQTLEDIILRPMSMKELYE